MTATWLHSHPCRFCPLVSSNTVTHLQRESALILESWPISTNAGACLHNLPASAPRSARQNVQLGRLENTRAPIQQCHLPRLAGQESRQNQSSLLALGGHGTLASMRVMLALSAADLERLYTTLALFQRHHHWGRGCFAGPGQKLPSRRCILILISVLSNFLYNYRSASFQLVETLSLIPQSMLKTYRYHNI